MKAAGRVSQTEGRGQVPIRKRLYGSALYDQDVCAQGTPPGPRAGRPPPTWAGMRPRDGSDGEDATGRLL